MNVEDLTAFNDQIAAMARAGLPLDRGLAELSRDMRRGKLRNATAALAADLKAGKTLPEALEQRKSELPPYYSSLAAAGIRTGRLAEVLATLTSYGRTVAHTRRIILDAMIYPLVVLTFGFVIIASSLLFVIPEFKKILQDFGMQLPAPTKFVFILSANALPIVCRGCLWLGLVLLVMFGGRFLGGRAAETSDRVLYALPILGTLIRSARLASYVELLALLVEYETPLPEAFRVAGAAASDATAKRESRFTAEHLEQGNPLAAAIVGRGLIPEWVAWMASEGERRGSLATALRQIALIYHRQVEIRVAALRSVFPPMVVLVTIGVITGVFAVSIMLPMIKLLEGLSK